MATIKEVAKAAGVSTATVSRVINNNGYVNEETKVKVLKAIKELEYKPNIIARSLYKKESKMIGLIVPDITNPFFPQLTRAVEDVANNKGYTVILGNSDQQEEKEKAYIDMMAQQYVDGLIIVSNTLDDRYLSKYNKPFVMIDRNTSKTGPAVVVNNREGAREAVLYLIKSGSRVIAHISGPENVNNAVLRCQGYIDIVRDKDWFHPKYIQQGDYTLQGGYKATIKLLNQYPEIDAIFAANDLMAIGVLKAARDLNLKVPEDLAVIGFDGIEVGQATAPELTTMQQPIYKIGEKATTLLLDLINKKPLNKEVYELPVELCVRQSTRPFHFSSSLLSNEKGSSS